MSENIKTFDILVVGSCNMDLISYVERIPEPGETVEGYRYETGFGGKGANQCIAAAKLGANTCMVARVGADSNGKAYIDNFKNNNVNTDFVLTTESSFTGVAPITVGADGSNSIVVIPGANFELTPSDIEVVMGSIKSSKVLVCQLEIRQETTLKALSIAKERGITTIFNPAPAPKESLDDNFYTLSDIFCPNETEASLLTGIKVTDIKSGENAAKVLTSKGCKVVVITMGKLGCILMMKEWKEAKHISIKPVEKVVDTTGAGDAFAGSLAFFFAFYQDMSLEEKVRRSCEVASESVKYPGTQISYPSKSDLPSYLF